jgi:hypothetical protein
MQLCLIFQIFFFLLIFIKFGTGIVHAHLLDAVTFMKVGKVDSDTVEPYCTGKCKPKLWRKKIDSRNGERPDDSREDSDFQRNSKLEPAECS